MLTKKRYSVLDMALWTRREALGLIVYAAAVTVLFDVLYFSFLSLPWTSIALIGAAVAFFIGFQNNSAYGRVWGGIMNTSRAWNRETTFLKSAHATETPFEGYENDVPISTISRGIEIDIRQQLGESLEDITKPFPEQHNVQM